jgi:hypothetical protein
MLRVMRSVDCASSVMYTAAIWQTLTADTTTVLPIVPGGTDVEIRVAACTDCTDDAAAMH